MTKSRTILVLIVVPAVVSVLVTLLILSVWDRQRASQPTKIVLPTHSGTALIPPRATQPPPPQSEEPGGNEITQEPVSIVPTSACENPVHVVASGETLGAIAEQYGVSIDDLVTMNQMLDSTFDPDFLAVRQELTIPVCGVPDPTPTGEPTNTSVPTRNVPTPIPTTTDSPAGSISVSIVRVLYPGDITREGVEIVNEGSPVDLDGWKLTNDEGDEFVFPSFRLFTGGGVTIFTGAGEDTPIVLYWGLNNAVWEVGYTVSLYDADGELHDEFEISE